MLLNIYCPKLLGNFQYSTALFDIHLASFWCSSFCILSASMPFQVYGQLLHIHTTKNPALLCYKEPFSSSSTLCTFNMPWILDWTYLSLSPLGSMFLPCSSFLSIYHSQPFKEKPLVPIWTSLYYLKITWG